MPGPPALARIVLGSIATAGAGLLGLSFHGMNDLDTRLAAAAQVRDATRTELVLHKRDGLRGECDERSRTDSASAVATPDSRDY